MFNTKNNSTKGSNKKGSKGHPGLFGTSLFEKPDTRSNFQKFADGTGEALKALGNGTKNVAKKTASVAGDVAAGAGYGIVAGTAAATSIAASQPQVVEVERHTSYNGYGGKTTTTTTTTTTGYGSQRRTTTNTYSTYERGVYNRVCEQFEKLYSQYNLLTWRVEIWEGKTGSKELIQSAIRDWNELYYSEIGKLEAKYGVRAVEEYKAYLREEKANNSATRTSNYI